MKSKMFLNNVTVIDFAYIDDKGMIIGDSVNPKFTISGEVDPNESVVVDFSTIKNELKEIIDAKYSGFDHKLWVIDGYSEAWQTITGTHPRNLSIKTPHVKIDAPKDAFKFIDNLKGTDYIGSAMHQMVKEVKDELKIRHPEINVEVTIEFDDAFAGSHDFDVDMIPFRYVHGLRNSTSWGCQNIAHGHLSYLTVSTENSANLREVEMLLRSIANDLDKMIFVWDKNIADVSSLNNLIVEYLTKRGSFKMEIEGSYVESHVLILETETTVEFLAAAIAKEYEKELIHVGVKELFVSEGLNKGAAVIIKG